MALEVRLRDYLGWKPLKGREIIPALGGGGLGRYWGIFHINSCCGASYHKSPASGTEHLRYMGLQVYLRVTTGEYVDQPSIVPQRINVTLILGYFQTSITSPIQV